MPAPRWFVIDRDASVYDVCSPKGILLGMFPAGSVLCTRSMHAVGPETSKKSVWGKLQVSEHAFLESFADARADEAWIEAAECGMRPVPADALFQAMTLAAQVDSKYVGTPLFDPSLSPAARGAASRRRLQKLVASQQQLQRPSEEEAHTRCASDPGEVFDGDHDGAAEGGGGGEAASHFDSIDYDVPDYELGGRSVAQAVENFDAAPPPALPPSPPALPESGASVFVTRIGSMTLRMTAKKLHKSFGRSIVGAALKAHNEKLGSTDAVARVWLDGREVSDPAASMESLLGDAVSPEGHLVEVMLASEVEAAEAAEAAEVAEAAEAAEAAEVADTPEAAEAAEAAEASQRHAIESTGQSPRRLLRQLLRRPPREALAALAALEALAEQWERSGWAPEARAVRRGLLWHAEADELLELRTRTAASAMGRQALELSYEQRPFAHDHAAELPATTQADVDRLGVRAARTLPRVRFPATGSEAPLPETAKRHLGSGMCFVMERAQLWPRAETLWGRRGHLHDALRDEDVRVRRAARVPEARVYTKPPPDANAPLRPVKLEHVPAGWCFVAPREASAARAPSAPASELGGDEALGSWAGYSLASEPPTDAVACVSADAFFGGTGRAPSADGEAVFLEHDLIRWAVGAHEAASGAASGAASDPTSRVASVGGSHSSLVDISGLNRVRLGHIQHAAAVGPPRRTTLTVSGRCTGEGAYTWPCHEPCDAVHLQLTGRRRFRVFPPSAAARLPTFPAHHPMDRCVLQPKAATSALDECGAEALLGPGEALYLPAWWSYQVLFEAPSDADELAISVSVLWDAAPRLAAGGFALPLLPAFRVELSRTLEVLVADCLGSPQHVAPFLRALRQQLVEAAAGAEAGAAAELVELAEGEGEAPPAGVEPTAWVGLLEWVPWKLSLLLGPHQVAAFVAEASSAERWAGLVLSGVEV